VILPIKLRVNIKSLMLILIFVAIALSIAVPVYKKRRMWVQVEECRITYVQQRSRLMNLTHSLARVRPAGVDHGPWSNCVFQLSEEPFVHPLRGTSKNGDGLSELPELAAKTASLRNINDFLEQRFSTTPITVETLNHLHRRIMQDYDTEDRLTEPRFDHPPNCTSKFKDFLRDFSK
jgi:hypothetical protein